MGREKRREPRYNVTVDANIRNGTGIARRVTVFDLSVTGCRIHSPLRRFGIDAFLTITIARVGFLEARVKWRDGDYHGILFDHPLHAAVLEHIREYLGAEPAYAEERTGPRSVVA